MRRPVRCVRLDRRSRCSREESHLGFTRGHVLAHQEVAVNFKEQPLRRWKFDYLPEKAVMPEDFVRLHIIALLCLAVFDRAIPLSLLFLYLIL